MSVVRNNLLTEANYTPYCGNANYYPYPRHSERGCPMPRTRFNGKQFVCPNCGWTSQFGDAFIAEYRAKWNFKE